VKKRKLWLLLGGIVLALVLAVTPLMAGCAAPAEEEKPPVEEEKPPEKVWELTYSTFMMSANVTVIAHNHLMDEIEKRTNGRVLFTERYHSAQLFSAIDTLKGLSKGGCHMAPTVAAFAPAELDLLCSFGPLLVDDGGVYLRAKTEMLRTDPRLIEEATRSNIHVLAADLVVFWQVCTTEKRLTKFEDLAGLKLIGPGSFTALIDAWGGTPMTLAPPEQYEATERGLIDGGFHGISDTYSTRLYEVSKYFTEIGIGPYDGTWSTSVNLDTWNSFPPDIQKIFHDEIDKITPYAFEIQRKDDAESVKAFREAGMILETAPDEMIQKVKALAPVAIDWWVNIKPEEEAARRQFIQDFLDIAARTTVPAEWDYDPREYFK